MKIAVFENEIGIIMRSFEAINLIFFNKEIEFKYYDTSQRFGDLNGLVEYDVVIVDIDLSLNSKFTGYQIIQEMNSRGQDISKIIVITGHHNVKERLLEIGTPDVPIISKPINIKNLAEAIRKIVK